MNQGTFKRGDLGGPTTRTIRLSEQAALALRKLMAGDSPQGMRQRRQDSYAFVDRMIIRYAAGDYLPFVPHFESLRDLLEASRKDWDGNPKLELAASIVLGWLNTHAIQRELYRGQ